MPVIETTNKLSSDQEEYRVCSKPFVFFRAIVASGGLKLMTATAAEDAVTLRAFDDQQRLVSVSLGVFNTFGIEAVVKDDRHGRPYAEAAKPLDLDTITHVATTVLDQLGFTDAHVLSLRDLRFLYDELSMDDNDDGAYLNDGMWVTADGRIVKR